MLKSALIVEDTPEHIKKLQRKIWLSKTPGERLLQAITDNETLYLGWKKAKEELAAKKGQQCRRSKFGK